MTDTIRIHLVSPAPVLTPGPPRQRAPHLYAPERTFRSVRAEHRHAPVPAAGEGAFVKPMQAVRL